MPSQGRPVALRDRLPYVEGFLDLRLESDRFATVDLSRVANRDSRPVRELLGLADWFSSSRITVDGIPFVLAPAGRELVSAPEGGGVSSDVPVGGTGQEMFLLLAAVLPPRDFSGIRRPKTRAITDPEQFVIHVRYADGTEDLMFPVQVRTGKYLVAEGVDLYSLPQLRRVPIRSVAIDFRMPTGRAMLAGVTVNTGRSLTNSPLITTLPAAAANRHLPAPTRPVVLSGKRITLNTTSLQAEFDVSQGITLRSLQNKFLKHVGATRFASGSFFELGAPGTILTSDRVNVTGVRLDGNSVVVDLDARPQVPIAGTLRLAISETGQIRMTLRVQNRSAGPLTPIVNFPAFSRAVIGTSESTWYFYPRLGGVINNLPTHQREPYSHYFPLQITGLFNPSLGGGMYLLVRDLSRIYKFYVTDKNAEGVDWRVEYLPREYQPGETIEIAETDLGGRTRDWRPQLAAYRQWAKTWYKPTAPRKTWFRDVYNYRQHYVRSTYPQPGIVQTIRTADLYDTKTKTYHLQDVVEKDRTFFGLLDYLHIFDFGNSDVYGRVCDYSHYEEIGGKEKLAAAIAGTQNGGVSVGLYIEGYLCDQRSLWGRDHVKEAAIVQRNGSPLMWPGLPEHSMCPAYPPWQDYLASVYRRVAGELKPMGMYIDEHGLTAEWQVCWSRKHGHPTPWAPLRGEWELGGKIRAAVPAGIATLVEHTPIDVNSQLHDGTLSYTVAFDDTDLAPHHVDLFRFIYPTFKVIQLVSPKPFIEGNWGLLKFPFFNGEGYWFNQVVPTNFEPAAQRFVRRALTLLHAHAEAFRSEEPEPLVPTENNLIYANRFPARSETVWTLYNAGYRTYRGPVLRVPHVPGVRYWDAWNETELEPVIHGDEAILNYSLGPRDVGCITRTRKE